MGLVMVNKEDLEEDSELKDDNKEEIVENITPLTYFCLQTFRKLLKCNPYLIASQLESIQNSKLSLVQAHLSTYCFWLREHSHMT